MKNNCTLQMQHLLEIFVNYSLFIALTLWPVHCEWISTYLTRIKMKLLSEFSMCCTHRALNILVYFEIQKKTWNNFYFDHTHRTSDCHVERLSLSPDCQEAFFAWFTISALAKVAMQPRIYCDIFYWYFNSSW